MGDTRKPCIYWVFTGSDTGFRNSSPLFSQLTVRLWLDQVPAGTWNLARSLTGKNPGCRHFYYLWLPLIGGVCQFKGGGSRTNQKRDLKLSHEMQKPAVTLVMCTRAAESSLSLLPVCCTRRGECERGRQEKNVIYPDLFLQLTIDKTREQCLSADHFSSCLENHSAHLTESLHFCLHLSDYESEVPNTA